MILYDDVQTDNKNNYHLNNDEEDVSILEFDE